MAAKPTKPENAATPLSSRARPSGIAIAKRTGRNVKATSPVLAIQVNTRWKPSAFRKGRPSVTASLESEEPMPSMMPQNASRATGSMNVLPSPWRNSQSAALVFCMCSELSSMGGRTRALAVATRGPTGDRSGGGRTRRWVVLPRRTRGLPDERRRTGLLRRRDHITAGRRLSMGTGARTGPGAEALTHAVKGPSPAVTYATRLYACRVFAAAPVGKGPSDRRTRQSGA